MILLWPLLGWLTNGLVGRRLPRAGSGWLAALTVAASFATALAVLAAFGETRAPGTSLSLHLPLYSWLGAGDLDVPRLLDRLQQAGFAGPLVFELRLEQALASLEYIRSIRPDLL